jgi:hypothetical protein
VSTATLLDPIGNLVGGLAIRAPGFWTNSGASALTALLSSATVTNILNANTINTTNPLTVYGAPAGSMVVIGSSNGESNGWGSVSGSNSLYGFVGDTGANGKTNFLSATNPPSGPIMRIHFPLKMEATETNSSLVSGFILADANGGRSATLDASTLTNQTLRYTTNAITALAIGWGKAYETNIAANFTITLAAPAATGYESTIIMVTNSSATDFKVTMPAGVWGTPGSGTPPAYYCTNKMLTKIVLEHYGQQFTNSSKVDYAP